MPSSSYTTLANTINKYLSLIPPDLREITKEIGEKIQIDYPSREIRINDFTVPLPDPTDESAVYNTIMLLLYAGGYSKRLDESKIKFLAWMLKSAVYDVINSYRQEIQRAEVTVEVKHVTEREQLAQQLTNYILSNYTIKTFYTITSNGKKSILGIYCFNGVVYEDCEEDIGDKIRQYTQKYVDIDAKVTRWVKEEVIDRIRDMTKTLLRYDPLTLAFENVIFDWQKFLDTGSIRESVLVPSPDIIAFHYIPHKLRVDLLDSMEGLLKFDDRLLLTNLEELAQKLCPKTLNAFKSWVDDKWPLLFEIIGYTLYPKYDLHKAIMLIGEGRNGKSTYLRLVKDILGPFNVVSESLQDLTDESKRFTITQLYHKLANIYPDLPNKPITSTGKFKILTGEDAVTADRKFKDPITFVNYAKLIFSANELPPVNDMTDAFWRRWIVIEFPHQFSPDPTFYEKTFTEQEKEGAIIVSLYAFRNAWLRRKFSFEGSEGDYKELWLRETNSVYAFIQDLLSGKVEGYKGEKCEDCRTDSVTLYSLYVKYCEMEDRTPLPKRQFTIEMERLGFRRVKIHGHTYYKGINLVEEGQQNGLDFFN